MPVYVAPTYPATYSGPTEDANAATMTGFTETTQANVALAASAVTMVNTKALLAASGNSMSALNAAALYTALGFIAAALSSANPYAQEFITRTDLLGMINGLRGVTLV